MADIHGRMDRILEEIAAYEVKLEEDPTQPDLGTRYLQRVVAQCREYMNRVTFYLQELSREEKSLKLALRTAELDLEFKKKEKLADDVEVRKQPSIADREATAAMMLRAEHTEVVRLGGDLLNVQETKAIVKFKHQELARTSNDIRTQRMLVKDDIETRLHGGEGYSKPQAQQDRTVAGGMPSAVRREPIDPKDLLNPDKKPDDMPDPVDETHARMIADFFNRPADRDDRPARQEAAAAGEPDEPPVVRRPDETPAMPSYADLLS